MNHDLKRRLIGASVLISLAIIFLPMILEHKPLMVDRGQMSSIPKPPAEKFQSSLITSEVPEDEPVSAVGAANTTVNTAANTRQPEPKPVPPAPVRPEPVEPVPVDKTIVKPAPVVAKTIPPAAKPVAVKPAPVETKTAAVRPKPQSRTKPQTKSKPTPASSPSSWVIQVGSFSNRDNAHKLVQRLRKAGLDTLDPIPAKVNGRQLYRVKVGPELDKRNAQKLLPRVKKVAGLQGTVVRYP